METSVRCTAIPIVIGESKSLDEIESLKFS